MDRYVEAHPDLFVPAITWAYKRNDGAIDPAEFQVPDERIADMAERSYKLIEAIQRIPGHNDLGELKQASLAKWTSTVRQSCGQLGRSEIADTCIGKLLACAPIGKDGVWPCQPVRDVMEDIESESLMNGARTAVYSSRGSYWRGAGGDQERAIVEKYRRWGQILWVLHTFVASKLLMNLAEIYDSEANREDTEAGIRRRLL